MPYLFRRQPLVAQWGSEWLGTYNEQVVKMIRTRACKDAQDLDCLKEFFLETGAEPDYLVVLQSDTQLVEQISDDADWNLVHENSRYIVWRNEDQ